MKIGLVARADRTGLAVLSTGFYKHMNPHKTLIVDLAYCSGQQPELWRYGPEATVWHTRTYPNRHIDVTDPAIDDFLDDLDIVMTYETPYNYDLFERARQRGVKTVLHYHYEFLEYLPHPDLPRPDLFIHPTNWHTADVEAALRGARFARMQVPVDRDLLARSGANRHRTEVRRLLHTVGNPTGTLDRNGTLLLLEAMQHVTADVTLDIHTQRSLGPITASTARDRRIRWVTRSDPDYWDTFNGDQDLYVMPRRFGGLSLPINEALALGMPVVMPNCEPNNTWLPGEMLVAAHTGPDPVPTRALLTQHNASPVMLAQRIDEMATGAVDVAALSTWAIAWGALADWDIQADLYRNLFNNLLNT